MTSSDRETPTSSIEAQRCAKIREHVRVMLRKLAERLRAGRMVQAVLVAGPGFPSTITSDAAWLVECVLR